MLPKIVYFCQFIGCDGWCLVRGKYVHMSTCVSLSLCMFMREKGESNIDARYEKENKSEKRGERKSVNRVRITENKKVGIVCIIH